MSPLLLLVSLLGASAPPAGPPSSEVLGTASGVARARASWIASTVLLARALDMRGDLERARTLLASAVDRAAADGDASGKATLQAELAVTLSEEAFYARRGAEEALQLAAGAQTTARSAGAHAAEARALHAEGFLLYGRLLWDEAKDFGAPRERFERAQALYRKLGDTSGLARETFCLGLTHEQEGSAKRAGELYAQARDLATRVGDRATLSYALRHLGGLAEERGALDQALALQRRSLALREEIGFVRLVPFALIAVGDLERRKGMAGDARAHYGRARALAGELRSDPALVWSEFGLGALDEAEGRLPAALEHYQAAQEAAGRLGGKSWIAETGAAVEKVRLRLGTPAPTGTTERAEGTTSSDG